MGKKFKNKYAKHLDYVNKAKRNVWDKTPNEINTTDKKLLDTFNYFI